MGGLYIFRLGKKKSFGNVLHRRLLWKLEHIGGLKGIFNGGNTTWKKGNWE